MNTEMSGFLTCNCLQSMKSIISKISNTDKNKHRTLHRKCEKQKNCTSNWQVFLISRSLTQKEDVKESATRAEIDRFNRCHFTVIVNLLYNKSYRKTK